MMMMPSALDVVSPAWDGLLLDENLNPVDGQEFNPLLDIDQLIQGGSMDEVLVTQTQVLQTFWKVCVLVLLSSRVPMH